MNKTENKLVPELRFPEFKNNGTWHIDMLCTIAEIKGRIGYRGYTKADIVNQGEGAITLSPSNFDENGFLNFEKCTYITWSKYNESPEIQLEEGQTVLVKTASVGKTAYVQNLPVKTTVNPQIVVLKPKKIYNRFLAYTISHEYIQNQIRNCVGAGAIPNLSQENISKFDVIIPPDKNNKEQKKIADCLSSLDDVIAAHTDKLENLKHYKKGLLQNVFPQDGEMVPKLRFKEFEKDGEWEKKNLGSIFKTYSGGTPNTTEKKYYGGDIPFIRSAEINKEKTELFITELGLNNSSAKIVKKGDLLVALYGANSGDVGISKINGAINQAVLCLKSDFSNIFVYHFLSLKKDWVVARYIQGGQGNLSADIVKSIELFLPKKEEQNKIASLLSSVDDLIKAESDKIEQLKAHKKGLLQGLFPKVD